MNRMFASGCVALALLASACAPSSSSPSPAASKPPSAPPLVVKGRLGQLRLVPLTRLSRARPHDAKDVCYAANPRSPEARDAMASGWSVLGEGDLGPLRFVTVADGGEFLAGAGCQNVGGSVLLYRAGRLVGVAYGVSDDLQHAEPRMDGVRLFDFLSPLAELRWNGTQVSLAPLPPEDIECGDARMPRVEGLTYAAARRRLRAAGWSPVPAAPDLEDPLSDEARKGGFPEVHGCAGTGLGQCLNVFVDAGGHGLEVTTTDGPPSDANGDGRIADDETPSVVAADIRCEGPRRD